MRYTGIPRYIRQEMIRKRKREEDFNVRKLNKPYPAYTIGEEVVDFVFGYIESPITVYFDPFFNKMPDNGRAERIDDLQKDIDYASQMIDCTVDQNITITPRGQIHKGK